MRGPRQVTRVTWRPGLQRGLTNNGWDIRDNSSVQSNISLDHLRTLPLYTSASAASPKVRESPEVMAGFAHLDQDIAPTHPPHPAWRAVPRKARALAC